MAERKRQPSDGVTLPAECCAKCRFMFEIPSPPGAGGVVDLSAPTAIGCRRFPPGVYAAVTMAGLAVGSAPPGVTPAFWCGEFKAATPVLAGA